MFNNALCYAEHKISGTQVVIKELPSAKYRRDAKLNQVSEAAAHSLCEHEKYVTRLIDEFREESKVYLVTKMAKGGTLYDWLCKQADPLLPEPLARNIFNQLVQAV